VAAAARTMSEITFGSVGDIIAVGQIALLLAKALSDARGSVKEYQCLIKELEIFDQALLQVRWGVMGVMVDFRLTNFGRLLRYGRTTRIAPS
jgi:hypothetical protein